MIRTIIVNGILLGIGLAMDAFSVSIADGLNEPGMRKRKGLLIALTFAVFQFAMPMIGWAIVHAAVSKFEALSRYIPYAAFFLLLWIGGKMIWDAIRGDKPEKAIEPPDEGEEVTPPAQKSKPVRKLGWWMLLVQGVATSIDALSVGFTNAEYKVVQALIEAGIIGVVTFGICMAGVTLGRYIGKRFSRWAGIVGGLILLAIGLKILIESFL